MEIALVWFVFAMLVGAAASSRGRSGFGWFLLSCIISPLLGLLLLIAVPKRGPPAAVTAGAEVADASTHVRCPECRELVRKDARKCKHCSTALAPQA